ncbi:hypothetical protein AgCh_022847 [Apium graveolens]
MDNFDMNDDGDGEHDRYDPVLVEDFPHEIPKIMNKKKIMHVKGHKKFEEKQKEKTVESVVDVSSKQLGYPLPQDVYHDGVLDFVRLAVVFDRVIDIQVEMRLYWNGKSWIEYINKENVLEVLNSQWLSSTSIIFYISAPKKAANDGIFCRYDVGCFIEDLLCNGEIKINVNFTYSPPLTSYPRDKMLRFQSNWAGYLYNQFFKDKLLMK